VRNLLVSEPRRSESPIESPGELDSGDEQAEEEQVEEEVDEKKPALPMNQTRAGDPAVPHWISGIKSVSKPITFITLARSRLVPLTMNSQPPFKI
jgi:hypothetical protein